jgi:hypothetical protein
MSGHSSAEMPEQKRQAEILISREHGYWVLSHRPFCRSVYHVSSGVHGPPPLCLGGFCVSPRRGIFQKYVRRMTRTDIL